MGNFRARRTPRQWWGVVVPLVMAGALLSCTDAGLQPMGDDVLYVDDKLSISGTFCTSPADEVVFPVKILIVIDHSASLQCTDPGNNRLAALNLAGAALDPLPNVEFGVVGFASSTVIVEFTPEWDEASAALAPENIAGGTATDYQGALSTVLRVLEGDMMVSGAAEVARTKYVVIFLSDGLPEPRCNAGCDDGDEPPDSLYAVCNMDPQEIAEEDYVDLNSMCPDYNQPPQILQKVQDIMALGDFYGAGDLTFSTILLFCPVEEIPELCGDISVFGYIKEEAQPLLISMADEGNGTFRDVNISAELDFLEFDYESLRAPYEMFEFFAVNAATVPSESGMVTDTDHDGLDDAWEFERGYNRLDPDTDGDYFSDLFEARFELHGFNALSNDVPAVGCVGTLDRDGDGLLECEENFLATDPLLADTDGDRIPDGIELRLGMDPTIHDTEVDHDFDGRLSGDEVRAGTSPSLFDEEDALLNQILYSVDAGEPLVDQTRCYDFTAQNLTLAPTLAAQDGQDRGRNRILIFAEEEPAGLAGTRGRYHVACVEARYLGETYKDPPSGIIEGLAPSRFVDLADFHPLLHCLRPLDNPAGDFEQDEETQ